MTVPVLYRPSPFRCELARHELPQGLTVAELLEAMNVRPEIWTHGVVRIGEHEIPRELWRQARPRAGRDLTMTVGIRLAGGGGDGKNPFAIIAAIAIVAVATLVSGGALSGTALAGVSGFSFAAGSTSAAIAAAGISAAGALLINALAPPPAVSTKDSGGTELGSASIRGANVLQPFQAIPFVAGRHRIAPPQIILPWTESINDDQFVNAIMGLDGQHDFSDIRINDVSIDILDNVTIQTRDVINDNSDLTLITQQVAETQINTELSAHKVQQGSTDHLQDTSIPSNSYPQWHSGRSASAPDEIWLGFFWTGLGVSNGNEAILPMRIRMREVGTLTWINLPEFIAKAEKLEPFRGMIKLRFTADPGGLTRLDQATLLPWGAALYVTSADDSESFDVDSYFTATTSKYAVHVGSEDGVAVVWLDPATFPKAAYEIQVMRGYGAQTSNFNFTTYKLSSNTPFFFTYTTSSSPPTIRQAQSKIPARVSWAILSSMWDEYPLGDGAKQMSLIAVRAKNQSIGSLTVLAEGYANVWNGEDWDGFEPTSNPAAWFRSLALGEHMVRAPFALAQLDDDLLTDWYDFCGDRRIKAAIFDGSTNYLSRDGGIAGADSKLWTASLWVKRAVGAVGTRLIASVTTFGGGTGSTRIMLDSDGRVLLVGVNAAASQILDIRSSILQENAWSHVLISIDMSNTSKRHIYVNDLNALDVINTYTDDTIDFTLPDWGVGGYPNGTSLFDGSLAELWFLPGTYIDFSVEANRRKFIIARGRPANLGADGSTPTGFAPTVYLSGEITGWPTNKGSGGGFTAHGTFTGEDLTGSAGHPNLEFNAFISSRNPARTVMDLAAASGQASIRASDKVGVIIEEDRSAESPIAALSQRNTAGLSIRRAFPKVPHGFGVRINDEDDDYRPLEFVVYRPGFDASNASDIESVNYVGITDRQRATDRARLDLGQLRRRGAIYELGTDVQNLQLIKGSMVALTHDTVRRHYSAARIASVATSGGNVTGLSFDEPLRLDLAAATDDFSTDTVSAAPDGWSSQWDANTAATVAAVAALPQGQGPLFTKSVGTGDAFWSWDDGDSLADAEILALIRPHADSGDTSNAVGLVLRGSGGSGTQTGYRAVLNSNSAGAQDKIEISKWVGGSFTFLANATFNWALDTNYWMRFRAFGTALKVKIWADGDDEPASWNVSTTDSSIADAGLAGAYIFNPASSFYLGSFRLGPMNGVVMQQDDGTTRIEAIEETEQTSAISFITAFTIPAGDILKTGCLVASGPFASVVKRMLVLALQPGPDLTAKLQLVDEAPELHQAQLSAVLSAITDFAPTFNAAGVDAMNRGHLFGLILSNNGTDANHDIDIATGEARSSDNAADMTLSSGLTKQIDAAWAAGTNAGGLDTGSVAANTFYYLWLIKNSSTGAIDVLFSASASAPTMPTGYDLKRRIGAVRTDGSANIRPFTQVANDPDLFLLTTPVLDVSSAAIGTTSTAVTLTSVPPSMIAIMRAHFSHSGTASLLLRPSSEANQAPSTTVSPLLTMRGTDAEAHLEIPVDGSSQIAARASTTLDAVHIATRGWRDGRGRLN